MSPVIVYVGSVKPLTSVHSSAVVALYMKFHNDSLAPGVHDMVAETLVTSVYTNAVGTWHAMPVVNDTLLVQALTSPPQFARTFTR